MKRTIGAVWLCGCGAASLSFDEGPPAPGASTGFADSPYEDPPGSTDTPPTDTGQFDGAMLRILAPASGDFLALEEPAAFEAELVNAAGAALDGAGVRWSSSVDAGWSGSGLSFEDDTLDVGVHDLTAEITLPNGDRHVTTVGGVLRQSFYAGTYSGLFSVEGTYNGVGFTCSGTGLTVCEPYGTDITGDADCLVSVLGLIDLPLAFVFELENADGVVTGTAGADIFGLFNYDFPAFGSLLPATDGLILDFEGEVPFTGVTIAGSYDAARVTLDAGL